MKLIVATTALAPLGWSQARLAQSPPLGWNSWDSFGTTVTEAEVKANADYMAANLAASYRLPTAFLHRRTEMVSRHLPNTCTRRA